MRVSVAVMAVMLCIRVAGAVDSVSIEKIAYDKVTSYVNISCVVDSSLDVGKDTLCVFQDGNPVKNLSIIPGSDRSQTVYVVFAFDSSKSISRKDMGKMKRAAGEFVSNTGNMQISVLKFDDNTAKLQPFSKPGNTLIRTIDEIARNGKKTKLYDAIFEGLKLLESADSSARELIVFTDGKDEGSSVTADDVINHAKAAKIPVNFWYVRNGKRTESVKRIASLTGGEALSCDSSGASLAGLIEDKPKRSYSLSYKASNQAEGFHTVEVQLVTKDVRGKDISQYESVPEKETHPVMDRMLIAVTVVGMLLLVAIGIILYILRKRLPHQKEDEFRQRAVAFEHEHDDNRSGVLHKGLCRAWLMQKDGPEKGKKFPLYWEETVVGRDKSCALSVNDSRVSPNHVRIRFVKNMFYIIDLASDEGTYINGKKLLRPKSLNDWDEITIGQTTFIFRSTNDRV